MRLAATIALAAALAAGAPQVHFPRDHAGHPGASIEWWYFTALVHDRSGRRYSVFFTLFASRGLLVPVAEVRDLVTGKIVGESEQLAPGRVGTAEVDVRAGGSRLRYLPAANTWSFSVARPGLRVALEQVPEKPYVLHGGGSGLIRQSTAGSSHYYSDTRMRASGTLRVGGRTLAISGDSWFDHQWGDYANEPRAFNWDWFSCRFADRTELMLYQFLDRTTGRPLAGLGNGTFVDARGHATGITAFTVSHDSHVLAAAGHRWPLDWTLGVPALTLEEHVRALWPKQLVRTTLLPVFWEGVARATGTRSGMCFVEIAYR
jgi:predicted secreted hydrolase